MAPLELGKPDQDFSCLRQLFSRKDVFAVDLYEVGLGEKIEGMVKELYAGPGAVRFYDIVQWVLIIHHLLS